MMSNNYVASICIATDEDFHLLIGGKKIVSRGVSFVTAIDMNELCIKVEALLVNATVVWSKKWSVAENSEVLKSGDYADRWTEMREAALVAIRSGEKKFHYGGNQEIKIELAAPGEKS